MNYNEEENMITEESDTWKFIHAISQTQLANSIVINPLKHVNEL